jgi:hypothetical protein
MVCATEVDTATCRFVPLRLVFRSNRTKKQPPLKPDIPNHSPRLFPISLSINIFLTEDWNAGYREDPSISCSKAPLSEIFKQLTAQHLVLTHSPHPQTRISLSTPLLLQSQWLPKSLLGSCLLPNLRWSARPLTPPRMDPK